MEDIIKGIILALAIGTSGLLEALYVAYKYGEQKRLGIDGWIVLIIGLFGGAFFFVLIGVAIGRMYPL